VFRVLRDPLVQMDPLAHKVLVGSRVVKGTLGASGLLDIRVLPVQLVSPGLLVLLALLAAQVLAARVVRKASLGPLGRVRLLVLRVALVAGDLVGRWGIWGLAVSEARQRSLLLVSAAKSLTQSLERASRASRFR